MKRHNLKLGKSGRALLYTSSLLLLGSGLTWTWIQRLDLAGELTEALRQYKPWLLRIHGFAALAFAIQFGAILQGHVRRAWGPGHNRGNGILILALLSLLIVSGYSLYYLGDEAWRNALAQGHVWLGVASPLLMIWHIRSGRRSLQEGP